MYQSPKTINDEQCAPMRQNETEKTDKKDYDQPVLSCIKAELVVCLVTKTRYPFSLWRHSPKNLKNKRF
jgi:hypothetical protein